MCNMKLKKMLLSLLAQDIALLQYIISLDCDLLNCLWMASEHAGVLMNTSFMKTTDWCAIWCSHTFFFFLKVCLTTKMWDKKETLLLNSVTTVKCTSAHIVDCNK